MNAEDLHARQAPLKEKYKADHSAAFVTLRAIGNLDADNIACKVETGRALVEAGLHPAAGGDGGQACSGAMLLEALAACAGVTLRAITTAIGFRLTSGSIVVEGDLDFRGALGVAKDAPVGFRDIRLAFDLVSDEPQERVDALAKLTERYCVVLQTLARPPRLDVSVKVHG